MPGHQTVDAKQVGFRSLSGKIQVVLPEVDVWLEK
jgi:hypothetical protein